jgi:spermidine synthase
VYEDPRLTIYPEDIRIFLDNHKAERYDVIIMDLTDPDTEELTVVDWSSTDEASQGLSYALYGPRFWSTVKSMLSPGGALSSHVGPVSPGGDPAVRRSGLEWTKKMMGAGVGGGYKVCIPSFQADWGFYMSVPRKVEGLEDVLPAGLKVIDSDSMTLAFTWPKYWFDETLL